MAPDDPQRSRRGGDPTGSTNPFDFDDTPVQTGSGPGTTYEASTPSRPDGFDPFGLDSRQPAARRPRTGQPVSWAAVIMVLVGALAIGFGVGGALTSIRLAASSPFGAVLWWGTLALVGVLLILVALVCSIVGVVQAEPRRVAVVALIAAVLLGWVAAYIGFRIGAHHLTAEAVRVVGTKGPQAVPAIERYLQQRGIDAGAYSGLLHRVFG